MIDYAYTVELTQRGLSIREPFIPRLLIDTLSGLGAAIEANERGEAVCPRVDFSIWATPEAKGFIEPLKVPEDLYVDIFEYNARVPTKRFRRFSGVLVELPRRGKSATEDVFIFSATGFLSTYDEVDVIDPVSGEAYRDTHYEDLIPALTAAAGHGALSASMGSPIKAADRWTSRLFYPGKHRFGGTYSLTHQIKALCNDGTRLYVGAGRWLCSYDPETREARKVLALSYKGFKSEYKGISWRLISLEWNSSKARIDGWAEPVIADLKLTKAHAKFPIKVYPPTSSGFEKFARSKPITVAGTGSALSNIDTVGIDVSALTFDTPTYVDRAIAYRDGDSWTEIDSDYRDIGDGYRIYFRLRANIGAAETNTTSYRLFWRGAGRVTKTNRDNIYLLWNECGDIGDFHNITGAWTSSGTRLLAPNINQARTVLDEAAGTPDVVVYGLVNHRNKFFAGVVFRSDRTVNDWHCELCWAASTLRLLGVNVAYPHDRNSDYIIKIESVGNRHRAWCSPAGTPITGVHLIQVINAAHPDHEYVGFWSHGPSPNSEYDNLYVLHAVTNDPTTSLGATELLGGFYDDEMIYCYDQGYYVRSRNISAENNGGPSTNDWAIWRCEQIGEATPPSDKTLGPPQNITILTGTMEAKLKIGELIMKKCSVTPKMANVGDRVHIKWLEWYQDMGEITKLVKEGGGGFWNYHVQHKSEYNFPATSWIFVYPKGFESVGPNLALPGFRDIAIEYDLPLDIGSPKALPITVERRRHKKGRTTYFWPEIYGTADENSGLFVPGPYVSLGEGNQPRRYPKDPPAPPNEFYHSEQVPDFRVKMENAAHFANLPVDKYWVRNEKQSDDQTQPGENVLIYNGTPVRIANEADNVLSTRGNIYLSKDGNDVYAAWNRYRWAKGWWFLQVVWGKLNGAEIKKVGEDRYYENYQSRPPREITSFKVFNGKYYFGIKRVEPRWKNTALQIVWGAPPQTELKPANYDGGLVATALVPYNKTDYLEQGSVIRLRDKGRPVGDKEYLISEVDTLMHEIATTEFSSKTYAPEIYTRLVLFSLDQFNRGVAGAYKAQARKELLDKYITIMEGYDIRGEICYADGNELKVGHTATAQFGEALDGDFYDWQQQEWHGESISPDEYGGLAEAYLAEARVIPGSVKVTMIADKREFIVTDKSDILHEELPVPPLGEVYIKTHEGYEYTETCLYLNPAYLGGRQFIFAPEVELTLYMRGQPFDVEYEYHTKRFYIEPFVLDGTLYFNETETGAIYRRDTDTTWTRVTAWPAPVAKVDVFDKDVYALAESDFALMKYGREWPGYINAEVGGADPISVFTALTKIAQAADCFLGEENGKIMLRPRAQGKSMVMNAEFENFETCQYIEQKQYRGVLITYDGGKAYVGQNDPPEDLILKRNAPYVFDYGLALELASRYYAYFTSGAIIYDVETMRRELRVPMLAETVDVGELSGRLIKYELRGPKIGMLIEKSVGGRLAIGD